MVVASFFFFGINKLEKVKLSNFFPDVQFQFRAFHPMADRLWAIILSVRGN